MLLQTKIVTVGSTVGKQLRQGSSKRGSIPGKQQRRCRIKRCRSRRRGEVKEYWLNTKTQPAKERTDWHLNLAGKNFFD